MAEIEAVFPYYSEAFPNAIADDGGTWARNLMKAFVLNARGVAQDQYHITLEAKAWYDANFETVDALYQAALDNNTFEHRTPEADAFWEATSVELGWNEALNTPTWFGFLKS